MTFIVLVIYWVKITQTSWLHFQKCKQKLVSFCFISLNSMIDEYWVFRKKQLLWPLATFPFYFFLHFLGWITNRAQYFKVCVSKNNLGMYPNSFWIYKPGRTGTKNINIKKVQVKMTCRWNVLFHHLYIFLLWQDCWFICSMIENSLNPVCFFTFY